MEVSRAITKRGRRYRVQKRVAGRLVRKSFETLEEAELFLESLHAARPRAALPMLTVASVVDEWFAEHEPQLTAGVRIDYGYKVAKIKEALGDMPVLSLVHDRQPIEAWLRTLPPPTRKKTHTVLVQALEDAVWKRRIPLNPARGIRMPKYRPKPLDIPTEAEVALIMRAAEAQDPLWGLFVRLSASLGTRRGETCALRWEDFDFEHHEIRIVRAVVRAKGRAFKVPKSGEPRVLRIRSKAFWNALEPYRRESGFLFEGVHNGSRRPNPDVCWYPDVVSRRFAAMVDGLGLKSRFGTPYRLHGLRHYVATRMQIATKDWVQVARFMGHLTPAMTMSLYANHVVREEQERLGEIAADLFASATAREEVVAPADRARRE